jgi:hypothetical protein
MAETAIGTTEAAKEQFEKAVQWYRYSLGNNKVTHSDCVVLLVLDLLKSNSAAAEFFADMPAKKEDRLDR